MPKIARIFPLALLGTLLFWGFPTMTDPTQASTKPASTLTGDIRHHPEVASRHLPRKRDVWVYVPPDYESHPTERYPVLYMHDGNNVFDAAQAFIGIEWQADETAERLIRAGEIPPLIIVAVSNTPDRIPEFTTVPGLFKGQRYQPSGQAYMRFLVEELKPMIDKTYRTRPGRSDTAVAGSSLGGLISLSLGRYHGDTFSRIAALSPAVLWADRAFLPEVAKMPKDLRLWVDMGGKEEDTFPEALEDVRLLKQRLLEHGYEEGKNLAYVEDPDGIHNEASWARRFPEVLRFLFGTAP